MHNLIIENYIHWIRNVDDDNSNNNNCSNNALRHQQSSRHYNEDIFHK